MAHGFRNIVRLGMLVSLFVAGSTMATEVPRIERAVVDLAQVFSASELKELSDTLHNNHQATGVQMAILTVRTTGGVPIEDFSVAVAEQWAGGSGARNDGLLLVFAIDDRQSRLEVGYGLESVITDQLARRWLDDVVPSMRDARYGDAARGVVSAVIARQQSADLVDGEVRAGSPPTPSTPLGSYAWFFLPVLFYLGIYAGVRWQRRRKELDLHNRLGLTDGRGYKATLALWIGAPILLALVFYEGRNYWLAMSTYWLLMASFGVLLEFLMFSKRLRTRTFCFAVLHIPFVLFPIGIVNYLLFKFVTYGSKAPPPPESYLYTAHDGGQLFGVVMGFGFLSAFGIMMVMSLVVQIKNPGTYRSTSSSSTRGTSSSSSRSSSSSSRSSSSSSSRSFSGGGGSFGGGGASSRW